MSFIAVLHCSGRENTQEGLAQQIALEVRRYYKIEAYRGKFNKQAYNTSKEYRMHLTMCGLLLPRKRCVAEGACAALLWSSSSSTTPG